MENSKIIIVLIFFFIVFFSVYQVQYDVVEVYNETVPIKEYQEYTELIPITKEVCKKDPIAFFKNLGKETGQKSLEGGIAGSIVPQLGTSVGGFLGAVSGFFSGSKDNIQKAMETGDISKLIEYCEEIEVLKEITKTKEITTFVTIQKTRHVTKYKSG